MTSVAIDAVDLRDAADDALRNMTSVATAPMDIGGTCGSMDHLATDSLDIEGDGPLRSMDRVATELMWEHGKSSVAEPDSVGIEDTANWPLRSMVSVATDPLDIGSTGNGPSRTKDSLAIDSLDCGDTGHDLTTVECPSKRGNVVTAIDIGVQACSAEEVLPVQDATGGSGSATIATPKAKTAGRSTRTGVRDGSVGRCGTRSPGRSASVGWRNPGRGSPLVSATPIEARSGGFGAPSTPRQQSRNAHSGLGANCAKGNKAPSATTSRPSSATRRPLRGDEPVGWRTSLRAEKRREGWRHAASQEDYHPSPEMREDDSPRETSQIEFAAYGDFGSAFLGVIEAASLEAQDQREDTSLHPVESLALERLHATQVELARLQAEVERHVGSPVVPRNSPVTARCTDLLSFSPPRGSGAASPSFNLRTGCSTPCGSGAVSTNPTEMLSSAPHQLALCAVEPTLSQMPQHQPSSARPRSPLALPRSPIQIPVSVGAPIRESTQCMPTSPGFPVHSPRAAVPRGMSPSVPAVSPCAFQDKEVHRFVSAGPTVMPVSRRTPTSVDPSRQVSAIIEPSLASIATVQTASVPLRPTVTRMVSNSVATPRCQQMSSMSTVNGPMCSSVLVNPVGYGGAATPCLPTPGPIISRPGPLSFRAPPPVWTAPLSVAPHYSQLATVTRPAATVTRPTGTTMCNTYPPVHSGPLPSQQRTDAGLLGRSPQACSVDDPNELSTRTAVPYGLEEEQDAHYDMYATAHLAQKSFQESLCDAKKAEDVRQHPSFVPRATVDSEASVRRMLQDEMDQTFRGGHRPRSPGSGSGFVYRDPSLLAHGMDDLRRAEAELRYTAKAEVEQNFRASLRGSPSPSTPSRMLNVR